MVKAELLEPQSSADLCDPVGMVLTLTLDVIDED